ncbi:hypothetical protein [Hoeflea poritis]|uniref:Uncharacterized protein n=1 Tax=Hoeflea poritis TaxID=2993659 RepID=A0ABT4VPW1_9HYPH|nr:hypothetical protein [Hoeflea poritis]MDA4846747.1 hypothetical protein [Hoeflea poritis]
MRMTVASPLVLTLVVAGLAAADPAAAQQITNDMSCEQAKAMYKSQGRVQTRTRSGTVLPIYGGVPEAEGRFLRCGRDNTSRPVSVITRDNNRCVIAYKC